MYACTGIHFQSKMYSHFHFFLDGLNLSIRPLFNLLSSHSPFFLLVIPSFSSPLTESCIESNDSLFADVSPQAQRGGGRKVKGGEKGEEESCLPVSGRLTSELVKAPDPQHECLFAPQWASDSTGPPAKKPPSYLPASSPGTVRETWWMKGPASDSTEAEAEESLTRRLRQRKQEMMKKQESEGKVTEGSPLGDGELSGGKGKLGSGQGKAAAGSSLPQVGALCNSQSVEERGSGPERHEQRGQGQMIRPPRIVSPLATLAEPRHRLPEHAVSVVPHAPPPSSSRVVARAGGPFGCHGFFHCSGRPILGYDKLCISPWKAQAVTYEITLKLPKKVSSSTLEAPARPLLPSSASPLALSRVTSAMTSTHVAVKRYSELLSLHHLWCEQGLVPPAAKKKFPPKRRIMFMGAGSVRHRRLNSRDAGAWKTTGEDSLRGTPAAQPISRACQDRARALQDYFEALLELTKEGDMECKGGWEGRRAVKVGKVVKSPLFWMLFGSSVT